MAIKTIEISGYRSIAHIVLNMDNITAFIGRNGSGKSNILSALNYFYRNLTGIYDEVNIFDTTNSLRNEICIKITYDMRQILRIVQRNLKSAAGEEKGISKEYETYYQKIRAIAQKDELVVQSSSSSMWLRQDFRSLRLIFTGTDSRFLRERRAEITAATP